MPLSKLDDASVSYVKDDVMFVNVCLDIAETRRSGTDAGTDVIIMYTLQFIHIMFFL
jgi:hypothetical protein